MRFRPSVLWLLVAFLWPAPAALAQFQYSGQGMRSAGTADVISSAGDNSPEARYSKAQKGANLSDWVRRLDANDPTKRLEAVKSLGESNDPQAIAYLIQAVNDPDPRIEAKAVDYLGKLHAADSTPFLIQKLFTVGTRDRLRQRIVMTLGKIGDPRASRPLLQYVSQDVNPDIRGAGIYALGEMADQSIGDDLKRFIEEQDDPRLKRLATEALTKVSTRQQAPTKRTSPFPTALEAALSTEHP